MRLRILPRCSRLLRDRGTSVYTASRWLAATCLNHLPSDMQSGRVGGRAITLGTAIGEVVVWCAQYDVSCREVCENGVNATARY